MAVLEDFRLVSVSPELQPFPPSPMDEACVSFGTHDSLVLPTRPLRNRPGPRQSPHRHPPKLGAQTTIGLVRRVYEEGPCRIKRHCARLCSFAWIETRGRVRLRFNLALLIEASAFGPLGRSYRDSRANIDGGTRYLAGIVNRYPHPNQ